MDPQFEELAREITQAVTKAVNESLDQRLTAAFGDSEGRVKKHIDEFENRAEQRMQMHFENLDETVTLAADGYAGTLEGIKRELSDLNEKVDTKFRDQNLILSDHNKRIKNLESR